MRNQIKSNGIAFTRASADVFQGGLSVASGVLDSVNNYAQYDYIHDGLLVFDGVFLEAYESVITIKETTVFEHGSTLWKPELGLYLFSDPKDWENNPPVKNNPFAFPTGFGVQDIGIYQVFSMWTEYTSGGTVKDASTTAQVNAILRNKDGRQNLYGVLVFIGSTPNKFASDGELYVRITYEQM